jgi:CheY-like chemotaxis protein
MGRPAHPRRRAGPFPATAMIPHCETHSVLVVDDDHDGADTLTLLLQDYGLDARAAYSARDAGQIVLDGFHPEALVMDLGLPEVDGYAVAREVCAALSRRPLLVALTGYHDLTERSRREGFDHHFLKPADPVALVAVLLGAGQMTTGPAT